MPSRVRRIALTGGIATGKSHVRARLAQLGVPTIDADVLARDVVAIGTPGLAAVVTRFGDDVLCPDGSLDRARLAEIVFTDPAARRDLEAIVHPQVRRLTDHWFESLDPSVHPFAVADVPLLFEAGRDKDFDTIIVVACNPETQVKRVMHRDGASEEQARRRLAAQWPISDKVRRADFVIETEGTVDDTNRQIDELLVRLRADRNGS
jgi:dephospho-CoA kinase